MKVKHLLQLDVLLKGISAESLASAPALPALESLLTHGCVEDVFSADSDAWLCQRFGAKRQLDVPIAPYAALGDGFAVHDGYWLRADPVHLHLMRDRMALLEATLPDVTLPEAQAMTQTLNDHFDGMQFFAPHPQRWYLRLPEPPAMQTCPPHAAIGKDVKQALPTGEDSKKWMVWLNEVQMLLHQHSVNERREAEGKLPVNSLWLWGGGVLQTGLEQPYTAVFSHDPLATGLAGVAARPLPNGLNALLPQRSDRNLLVLDWAEYGWHALEQQWFFPIKTALKRGVVKRLEIHIAHGAGVSRCTVTQGDLLKFWRRKKSVSALINPHPARAR